MITAGVADLIKRELRNGEIFVDWFGNDPYRLVSTNQTMRFIKPGKGMVGSKIALAFKGKEGAVEISQILQILRPSLSENEWHSVIRGLPHSVREAMESMQPEAIQ